MTDTTNTHTIVITASGPIQVQEHPARLTKEQIHTEAERIREEHRRRRQTANRFIALGRVLERYKDAPPGTAIWEPSVNLLRDLAYHEDLPERVSKELWEWLHAIDIGEYQVEPDRRTWAEICADLDRQGIGRTIPWPEYWAICQAERRPEDYNGPPLSEEEKAAGWKMFQERDKGNG